MTKHFCCCFSLKIGALIMAFANAIGGLTMIIDSCVRLNRVESEGDTTYSICSILLGIEAICSSILLVIGIIQAKDKYILLFLLLGFINLFVSTIYSGINMFEYGYLTIVFFISIFLWYCLLITYYFFEEVLEYNTVKSGVIEISYNDKGHMNTLAIEDPEFTNTAV